MSNIIRRILNFNLSWTPWFPPSLQFSISVYHDYCAGWLDVPMYTPLSMNLGQNLGDLLRLSFLSSNNLLKPVIYHEGNFTKPSRFSKVALFLKLIINQEFFDFTIIDHLVMEIDETFNIAKPA